MFFSVPLSNLGKTDLAEPKEKGKNEVTIDQLLRF